MSDAEEPSALERLRRLDKRLPGVFWVAILLWVIIALPSVWHDVSRLRSEEIGVQTMKTVWELFRALVEPSVLAVALAFVFYQLGRSLDELFDFVFAPKTDGRLFIGQLGKLMRDERRDAAKFSRHGDAAPNDWKPLPGEIAGIYSRSKILAESTDDWKTQIQPLNEFSKTFRTFVIPLLVIGGLSLLATAVISDGDIVPDRYRAAFAIVTHWAAIATILAGSGVAMARYVVLRLNHMRRLYGWVRSHTKFERVQEIKIPGRSAMQSGNDVELSCPGCIVFLRRLVNETERDTASIEVRWLWRDDFAGRAALSKIFATEEVPKLLRRDIMTATA